MVVLLKDALREGGLSEASFQELLRQHMEEYTVIIYPAEEGGYWAKVPSLPGCYSQGETIDDTLANVKEAIESHIIALREEGHDIPGEEKRPIITSSKVEVATG